jgi:hypothetical protein
MTARSQGDRPRGDERPQASPPLPKSDNQCSGRARQRTQGTAQRQLVQHLKGRRLSENQRLVSRGRNPEDVARTAKLVVGRQEGDGEAGGSDRRK